MKLSAILKLDASEFTGPLKSAASASESAGGSIRDSLAPAIERVESSGRAAGRSLADLGASGVPAMASLAAESDDAAASLWSVSDEAAKVESSVGKAAATTGQIKQLAVAFGGLGLNLASAALGAAGFEREAGLLSAAGQGAMQGGQAGLAFGPKGVAIGAAVGAGTGLGAKMFGNAERDRKEAEALSMAIEELGIAADVTMRQIRGLEDSGQAEGALRMLREEATVLQARMERGLVAGPLAELRAELLAINIGRAEGRFTSLRRSEEEQAALSAKPEPAQAVSIAKAVESGLRQSAERTARAPQIATDSLARIGGFVGGAGRMEGIAERTAKAGEQAARFLQQIAARAAGRQAAAWA